MSHGFDKRALRDELAEKLAAALATLEAAHKATQEGATHESAKPENDKDTRALEQSYLARGQAARVEELRAAVAAVRAMPVKPLDDGAPASLGALVEIDDDERTSWLFLAPAGGGERLAAGRVQVVTPRSPLGRALLGKRAGDDADLAAEGARRRSLDVLRVA